MRVVHSIGESSLAGEARQDAAGFLLANRSGGYVWLHDAPTSRYQGWFVSQKNAVGKKLYRVIENIEVNGAGSVSEIRNTSFCVERKRGAIVERFLLPHLRDVLVYEINTPSGIDIVFDVKESYDNAEEGREYTVVTKGGKAIVEYRALGKEPSCLYAAIVGDGKNMMPIREWKLRTYSFDKNRASPPYERFVYQAVRFLGTTLVCAVSEDKRTALREAEEVFQNLARFKRLERHRAKEHESERVDGDKKVAAAYHLAARSLSSLTVQNSDTAHMYAGLPWFFQFWSRDEAISLKALEVISPKDAHAIFWRLLASIPDDGAMPNSADATGWIVKRAEDFIMQKRFNKEAVVMVREKLKKIIHGLQVHHTKEDIAIHNPRETWMDSVNRGIAAVEIQAERLAMHRVEQLISDPWRSMFVSPLETKLAGRLRSLFWNGTYLADSFDPITHVSDWTIRPNVFLAAYLYPKLLTKSEWIRCFEHILPRLWLSWGGLATIDTESPLFHAHHSGEPALSYHNGDSWFFLNNLAAHVMHQIDRSRFKTYINKILEASTDEILWHGILGHHAELSSAEVFESHGCLAQGWSSAMYMELASKLKWRFV